jgi:anti-sigma-K factor RskA
VLTCEEVADLATAVALDAADPRDRRALAKHLAVCPACAVAVDEMRLAAAALGSAVPQVAPPPELRARVMAAARREPLSLRRLWWRLRPVREPRPAAAWGLLAASIVISLGSFASVVTLQRQVASLESEVLATRDRAARYDRIVQVLGSHRLAVTALTPVGQSVAAGGLIYLDPASESGMVAIHDLPMPPQGRAWQLWFVRGTERVSGGMLWPDMRGNCNSLIKVPQDLDSFDGIGITMEPSGGSKWPTSPRVISAQLATTRN